MGPANDDKSALHKAIQLLIKSGCYCGRWIADVDLLDIINHEFEVPIAKKVPLSLLRGVLKKHYGHAECNIEAHGLFRKWVKPNKFKGARNRKQIYCSFFYNPPDGIEPAQASPEDKIPCVVELGENRLCGFDQEMKQALHRSLIELVKKNHNQNDLPVSPTRKQAMQSEPKRKAGDQQPSHTSPDRQQQSKKPATFPTPPRDSTSQPPDVRRVSLTPAKAKGGRAVGSPTTAYLLVVKEDSRRNKNFHNDLLKAREDRSAILLKKTEVEVACPAKKSQNTCRKKANDICILLASKAGGNPDMMAEILHQMLQLPGAEHVKSSFMRKVSNDINPELDTIIVNRYARFLARHELKKGGTRPLDEQAAVAAVIAGGAWMDGEDDESSNRNVAERLGVRIATFCKAKKYLESIVKKDKAKFTAPLRKQRKDSVLESAALAVYKFCHSEESSLLDTNCNLCRRLPDLERSGELTKHPYRVWLEVTWQGRYEAFLESVDHRDFKKLCPAGTIGLTRFRELVCLCVKGPTAQSCSDIIDSGLTELQGGLRTVIASNKFLRTMLDRCDCPLHKNNKPKNISKDKDKDDEDDKEDDEQEEEEEEERIPDTEEDKEPDKQEDELNGEVVDPYPAAKLLENLVKLHRVSHMVRETCCDKVEQPMLCQEVGGVAPSIWPRTCTHPASEDERCGSCGVDKLQWQDCPIYQHSVVPTKVLVWEYDKEPGPMAYKTPSSSSQRKSCPFAMW
jgi:hypothetical protein